MEEPENNERIYDLERENKELRRLLWMNHGHICELSPERPHSQPQRTGTYRMLYGDDGEMQCASCMVDFKRLTPREIAQCWRKRAAAAEMIAGGW